MHFKTLADKEFQPDQIARFIEVFERQGWSGPHTYEGRLLSHALNHCVEQGIPFTLMFVPQAGYYVKQAYPDNFVPADIVDSFKRELQDVANRAGDDVDEEVYGALYDMEPAPETVLDNHYATVAEVAVGRDTFIMTTTEDSITLQKK